MASILRHTPPSVTDVNAAVPRELAKLVKRCLAKDPTRRYQSTIDLRNDLEEIKADLISGEPRVNEASASTRSKGRRRMALGLGIGLALGVLVAVLSQAIFEDGETPLPRLTNPVQVTSAEGLEDHLTWSNHLGLFAEETGPCGEALGNFPPAFTHLALVSAAFNLDRALGVHD